jgi:hypothetical protein
MFRSWFPGRIGAAVIVWIAGVAGTLQAREHRLNVQIGEVAFTLVGQVTNTSPAQSIQFGYLPTISGLTDLFASPTEDETTAFFTFYNDTTTKAVRHNGPLTIIEREGTTTVYYNVAPHASFADPSSFQDGQAVLVMDLKQQVIVDTITGSFSVVMSNDVTAASSFSWDGSEWQLAHRNSQFRWALQGHLNGTPPPSGHFAAYVVKVQGD